MKSTDFSGSSAFQGIWKTFGNTKRNFSLECSKPAQIYPPLWSEAEEYGGARKQNVYTEHPEQFYKEVDTYV
jgi:hypothetical protein